MPSSPVLDPLAHHRRRGVWTDPGRLDPDWERPRARGRLPRRLTLGVPALLIAALIVVVWLLGGFGRRHDRVSVVTPGATISSGEYRMTFTQATAEAATSFDKKIWRVRAYGTIRTVGDTAGTPAISDSSPLVAQCPADKEIVSPQSVRIGTRVSTDFAGGTVTPGLPAVPAVWEFDFSTTCTPTELLRLVVFDQRYYDNTLLKTGEKGWHTVDTGSEVRLPVTVLP